MGAAGSWLGSGKKRNRPTLLVTLAHAQASASSFGDSSGVAEKADTLGNSTKVRQVGEYQIFRIIQT